MTVHWLDAKTLERHSRALCCRRIYGRHTYDVLANVIESVLNDFKIKNKTTLIVTDSGSNFLKAFRIYGNRGDDDGDSDNDHELEEEQDMETAGEITHLLQDNEDFGRLPPHHCCAAHSLNLLSTTDVEEAVQTSAPYKKISRSVFFKCQALFNKQNKSSLAAEIVKNHLGRYLVVPGATRWNSFYDSLEVLKSKECKLDDLCRELNLPTFKRPQDMNFLEEYCKVMEPVAAALDILQGEKHLYMGFLLPTLAVVQSSIEDVDELTYCQPLKDALLKGFKKR